MMSSSTIKLLFVIFIINCNVLYGDLSALRSMGRYAASACIGSLFLSNFPMNSRAQAAETMISSKEDSATSTPAKIPVKNKIAIESAVDRVLTLSAYLEEMERSILVKKWSQLVVYCSAFAEQDGSFISLIDGLFPSNDGLDRATRSALSYEAQEMFVSIDSLLDSAKLGDPLAAQRSYARLILNYDHFLKAGNLYPTYDPITSTEVFFKSTPLEALQFDASEPPQLMDRVLIIGGPDMGKTGVVILAEDGRSAVVKLDRNGRSYSEIKVVKLNNLGRAVGDERNSNEKNKQWPKFSFDESIGSKAK